VRFGALLDTATAAADQGVAARLPADGKGITELARLSVTDMRIWIESLQQAGRLSQRENDIARDLIPEIQRSAVVSRSKSASAT
jgi:excinuclease ABC subunit A